MTRDYEVALAVSLLSARSKALCDEMEAEFQGSEELRAIAAELENISNALAGAVKCRCGRYHDPENVPENCR